MTAPEMATLAAAQPASGRAPHTGCRAQEVPRDKTVACAASAQRTRDMRPRHSAGRPPGWRCGGDASRPWQWGPESGSWGDPCPHDRSAGEDPQTSPWPPLHQCAL